METNIALGMSLIIMGGIFSGTFAIPFKPNKKWAWENNWLLWSIMALVIMPWLVSLLTVPNLISIYQQQPETVLLVLIFGIIWGIGAILWGLGMDYLGIALSVPIMSGLNNSVGTLMPIIIRNPDELLQPEGIRIIIGVVVLLLGIVVCSVAGSMKAKALSLQTENNDRKKSRFMVGLFICLLAGIIGPMINFGFVYGQPLQQKAIEYGSSLTFSSNAIWSIVLTGGFAANLIYCIYLMRKNKTAANYRKGNSMYWILALLAGVLWYFSIMFYGMGGSNLGKSGASIGWATMQSVAIVAANIAGILSGEWKGASVKHFSIMFSGMAVLIVGIIIIAH
ncbi:MAG: rhamnose/proton symporter RhaT [Salinivirgaceae bacterium]|jgi:L-rhamnose-H+ transport protein|nr:rhamnose/proton symporter RhaT [Salinivirgaceae bacterium]